MRQLDLRPEGIQYDLTITTLTDAMTTYAEKSEGGTPCTLLVHPSGMLNAYRIKRETGGAAEFLHVIGIPGFTSDMWMLLGPDGYIIHEGA